MNEIRNFYPGIVSVEYFDSNLLMHDRLDIAAMAGLKIEVPEERYEIPLIEPGTCEVKSLDGAESVSLKFSAQIKICPPFRAAFIFRDANNRAFIIASKTKPYPKISQTRTFGSLPDARPEISYEITHVALVTPIQVNLD